ncbi:MAG: dTDP-4-dehydrorhamnose 3,5-epimerase [bacterium]
MKFTETKLKNAYVIEIEPIRDERGFFARSWCKEEFEKQGIDFTIVQCNISYNEKKGTLRGMHYQIPPHEEGKLVCCTRGAIYDVIIDLRPLSPTYGQWDAVKLHAEHHTMVYIPKGCAHGFQTLEDKTEVFYQMSEFYYPECARGIRWDDPSFMINWPWTKKRTISKKDINYPLFEDPL